MPIISYKSFKLLFNLNFLSLFTCVKVIYYILIFFLVSIETFAVSDFHHVDFSKHRVQILENGTAALLKRVEMIRRAKSTIEIESFIISSTSMSVKLLIGELIKKVQEGVRVRILLDHIYVTFSFVDEYTLDAWRESGIEVKVYNPTLILRLKKFQYLTHRKLLVVDGKEFITGGRNIADGYFGFDQKIIFVDRDIWIQGPITNNVKKTFDLYWKHKISQTPKKPKSLNDLARAMLRCRYSSFSRKSRCQREERQRIKKVKLKMKSADDFILDSKNMDDFYQSVRTIGKKELESAPYFSCNNIEFISDPPGRDKNSKIVYKKLYQKMSEADSLIIETPYFVVQDKLRDIFGHLSARNVPVTLVTNGLYSTNFVWTVNSFKRDIKKLIRGGIQTYVFDGQNFPCPACDVIGANEENMKFLLHSKSMVINDSTIMIGSYNFHPRSKKYDSELVVLCHDNKDLAHELTRLITVHQASSTKLDRNGKFVVKKNDLKNSSLMRRIALFLGTVPAIIFNGLL